MRVAIMGTGSLGTILGAYIARSGKDITLIDAYKEHVDALNKNGAKVTGKAEFTQAVKAITPDQMEGIYDIVIYMTKAPANEVALNQLLPHLDENSVVVTMQNGVPEEAVASYVGRERTMGGTVGWGAALQEPGVSMLTTDEETVKMGAFEIGELDGQITERAMKVKEVLESMGHTAVLDNLAGARWAKLFLNATYSGLSAALGIPYGGILDNPKAFKLSTYVGNEEVKAARLNGVYIIDDFQGQDIKKAEFDTEEERLKATEVYKAVFTPHYNVTASMLNDMRRGIFKTEIQQINGAVVAAGKKVGYPTPFNEKIVELVERAQATETVPTIANLEEFDELMEKYKLD